MSTHAVAFDRALDETGLIAILRGLTGTESVEVVEALYDAGVRLAEVPLNSPDPFTTIAALAAHFQGRMLIGAGTVVTVAAVEQLAATGCAFCVAPNSDPAVIAAALSHGMVPLPGFATATEAFAAVAAGARHLKAFPAHGARPRLSALSAVLPKGTTLIAVGGVGPADIGAYREVGVHAFGVGTDLYRPGRGADEVGRRARAWMHALQAPPAPVATLAHAAQTTVGESPVVAADGAVYWVDPTVPCLLRWGDTQCTRVPLGEPVWSLGRDGAALVGNGETHFLRLSLDGSIQAGPEVEVGAGCRLNDMVVDSRGGLWGGTMHRGLLSGRGTLFHAANVDAPALRVADGLGVANGMAFSADERTLFVIDTLARTLLAYPADIAAGTLGEPRVVTDFLGVPGKPDGMAMAADGHLWVAMWGGHAVVELAPNGAVLRSIPVPAAHVGSLAFAADGRLFITTARARLSDADLARSPGAGGLFVVNGLQRSP
ncbi:2-dehydro-3-deoxy-6-phosphogalactonate aldolase [Stenotrophomonas bentonitica]|uniref:2-dehydro-3-deoxy-6-phosphogalactonate aldolase n=1 Tax=Stenotrophomonas bentonitica TaxID=1450134 RepID=UPI00345E306F